MARFSKPSGKAEKTTFSFSLCGGAITLKRLEKICQDLMRFGGAFTSDRNVTVLRLKPDSAKVASLPAATPPPAFHVSGVRETWKCKSVSNSLSRNPHLSGIPAWKICPRNALEKTQAMNTTYRRGNVRSNSS